MFNPHRKQPQQDFRNKTANRSAKGAAPWKRNG